MLRTVMLMSALMFKGIFSGRVKRGIGCEEFFGTGVEDLAGLL